MFEIISGGQTGVDIAALEAATLVGLRTGGYAPKGWRTLRGANPRLADYGLKELNTANYRERTRANVQKADATLTIAVNWNSAGMRCTARAIKDYKKPVRMVPLTQRHLDETEIFKFSNNAGILEIAQWIFGGKYQCINVAGNSEDTAPGIQEFSFQLLSELFIILKSEVA